MVILDVVKLYAITSRLTVRSLVMGKTNGSAILFVLEHFWKSSIRNESFACERFEE